VYNKEIEVKHKHHISTIRIAKLILIFLKSSPIYMFCHIV